MFCKKTTLKKHKKEYARLLQVSTQSAETAAAAIEKATTDISRYKAMTHSIVVGFVPHDKSGASFLIAQPDKKSLVVKSATGLFQDYEVGSEVVIPPPTAAELSVFSGQSGYKCQSLAEAHQTTAGSDNLWVSYCQIHQVDREEMGAHAFASVFYASQEAEADENYYAITFVPPAYVMGSLVDNAEHAPPFALIPLNYSALGYAIYRRDASGVHFETGTGAISVVRAVDVANHHHPLKYKWSGDFHASIDAAVSTADMELTLGREGGNVPLWWV